MPECLKRKVEVRPTFGDILWVTLGKNAKVLSFGGSIELHSKVLNLVLQIQLRPFTCVLKTDAYALQATALYNFTIKQNEHMVLCCADTI